MKFDSVVPVLYSSDINESIAYYTEKLGFTSSWTWGDDASFGGVGIDKIAIFFCKEGQGHPGTWLCLNVGDVDEYYDSIKEKGASIISAPATMEWNMREMMIRDPDGHILRVGHRTDDHD